MKRLLTSAVIVGLFAAVTIVSNSPLRGDNTGRTRGESEAEVQIGFGISPVKLNLNGKDPELVGLGSYIVDSQGACNDS